MKTQSENSYRLEQIELFSKMLDETVVISTKLKNFIRNYYLATNSLLFELTEEINYSEITNEECYQFYNKVKEELDKINIFSDNFKQMIYSKFYVLIDSFNPRHLK